MTLDRLWLAPDIVLTRDAHLVTLASPRWEPGTLVYDVAFLSIHVGERRDGLSVRIAHEGADYEHQVRRIEVPALLVSDFRDFVGRAIAARESLGRSPSDE